MSEISYDDIMALVKKYCELVPKLSPDRRAEMEAITTPECAFGYPDGEKEADILAAFWDQARFHLIYEPKPYYIHVDERQRTADCILREEARDPSTGELIEDFFETHTPDALPGERGVSLLHEHFSFAVHEGKPKIDSVFASRINGTTDQWNRWVGLSTEEKRNRD